MTATLRALYLRAHAGAAPRAHAQAQAHAGLGLEGDVQADAHSPRQLLIAGAPAYARLGLAPNALRENLLLDLDTALLRSGQLLAVGDSAVLQLTFACEPCGKLDKQQARLARTVGDQRGMLARVLHGGPLRVGDPVRLLPETAPAWSDDWRDRVAAVLARVPPGMVVNYRQLAVLAGVAPAYCRVFPGQARRLGMAARAVSVRSDAALPHWDGAGLFGSALPPTT